MWNLKEADVLRLIPCYTAALAFGAITMGLNIKQVIKSSPPLLCVPISPFCTSWPTEPDPRPGLKEAVGRPDGMSGFRLKALLICRPFSSVCPSTAWIYDGFNQIITITKHFNKCCYLKHALDSTKSHNWGVLSSQRPWPTASPINLLRKFSLSNMQLLN